MEEGAINYAYNSNGTWCTLNVSARIAVCAVVIFARARELSIRWDVITRNVTAIEPTTQQQQPADLDRSDFDRKLRALDSWPLVNVSRKIILIPDDASVRARDH